MASDGQRLKSRSRAWLSASRCRLAKASRSRELRQPLRIPSTATSKQEPLREANSTPVAAIGDGLEEADQNIRNGLIGCSRAGLGHWQGEIPLTQSNPDRPAKGYADRLLGGPVPTAEWIPPEWVRHNNAGQEPREAAAASFLSCSSSGCRF